MANVIITHRKISGKPAGPDSTKIYGAAWDDTHAVAGLESIDNTSDADKPVSTATRAALDAKVGGPTSVTNDLPAIFDGTTGKLIKSKTYTAFKILLGLAKGDVSLGNVDNTSDANKPVSTAQATAIALKANTASPAFTGIPTAPTAAPGTSTAQLATTAFVADGIAATKPSFSAYSTSNQTGIPSTTETKAVLATEEWDNGGYYDAPNSRWTPPAGKGRISASAYFSAGVVDQAQYQVLVYKNGVQYRVLATVVGSGPTGVAPGGSCSFTANGTDYFELWVYGGGAGTKALFAAPAITYFQGEMF